MANFLFNDAREAFLTGQINWLEDAIKVMLVHAGIDLTASDHHVLSDVGTSFRVNSGPITLTNKTAAGGAADGADCTFTAVTGSSIRWIVIYRDGENEADSLLIAAIDTATGLPITPNGGDIIVTWDNGQNKIFKL